MARDGDTLFSIITPSTGRRPKALQKAVQSVEEAARFAGLERGQLEILVGFGGAGGKAPHCAYPVRCLTMQRDDDHGHDVRNKLLKLASGEKLVFLDDDNALKPYALSRYLRHFDAEMIIGRIDAQLAFEQPVLPVFDTGSLIRPGNVKLLCLCLARSLVVDRCGGWKHRGREDADFRNILDWHARTGSVTVLDDVVGVYDAGRSLDSGALSWRQMGLLDEMAAQRGLAPCEIGRTAFEGLALA